MVCILVLPLRCSVQQYAWGKIGRSSEVAQLAANDATFSLQQDAPYAEV